MWRHFDFKFWSSGCRRGENQYIWNSKEILCQDYVVFMENNGLTCHDIDLIRTLKVKLGWRRSIDHLATSTCKLNKKIGVVRHVPFSAYIHSQTTYEYLVSFSPWIIHKDCHTYRIPIVSPWGHHMKLILRYYLLPSTTGLHDSQATVAMHPKYKLWPLTSIVTTPCRRLRLRCRTCYHETRFGRPRFMGDVPLPWRRAQGRGHHFTDAKAGEMSRRSLPGSWDCVRGARTAMVSGMIGKSGTVGCGSKLVCVRYGYWG